jgi:hypothetical protein
VSVVLWRRAPVKQWSDSRFVALPETARLLVLYCYTGPDTNRIGLFRFSLGRAGEAFNATPARLASALNDVCAALGWQYDPDARVLWITTWWETNAPESPDVMSGCLKDLGELPRTRLYDGFRAQRTGLSDTVAARFADVCARYDSLCVDTSGGTSPQTSHDRSIQTSPQTTPTQKSRGEGELEGEKRINTRAEFDAFWQVFPKRKGKADAEKAWKAIHQRPDLNVILAAVDQQAKADDWTKNGGQFIPYPATWLRSRRWEDEHSNGSGQLHVQQPRVGRTTRALQEASAEFMAGVK